MKKVKQIDLNALEVISPCSVGWDEMQGDDKVRFCDYCEKSVFNLVSMTRTEIADLLADEVSKGNSKDVCIQMVKTTDGKLVTADCVRAKEKFALTKYAGKLARWVAVFLAALVSGSSPSALAQGCALDAPAPQEKTADKISGVEQPGLNKNLVVQLQGCPNGTIGPQGSNATVVPGVNTAGTVRVGGLANVDALPNMASAGGRFGAAGLAVGALLMLWKQRRANAPITVASIGKWLVLPGACVVGLCLLANLLPVEELPVPLPILQFLLQKSEITLGQERTIDGITFPAGSDVGCGMLGTLKHAQLNSPAVIHNIAFPANTWIEFYPNLGQLAYVHTHTEISFGKVKLSGKNIHLGFDGPTSVVSYATASDSCLRVDDLYFAEGQSVSFYHDGTLRSGNLATKAVVNGVHIGRSNTHANGEPMFVYLPAEAKIGGLILEAGSVVSFFPNRSLEEGTLKGSQTIKGISCTGDFQLFDNGNPRKLVLAIDQKVCGKHYKAGELLFFDKSGEVSI